MRIAFFTDSFDFYEDYVDGIAVIAQRFADYAVRKKIQLEIFTVGEENSTEVLGRTVKVHRFKPIIRFYMPWHYESPHDCVVPRKDIIEYFKENKFDIIHFTLPSPLCFNAIFLGGVALPKLFLTNISYCAGLDLPDFLKIKSNFRIPLVGSFHSDLPEFTLNRTKSKLITKMIEGLINISYRNCDLILATSECIKNKIKKYIRNDNISVIKSGVNTKLFNPYKKDLKFKSKFKNKIVLLYVGRITPEKNIKFLVLVYKRLLKKHKDLHLILVGDGNRSRYVKNELKDNVTLTGFLHDKELARIYASSDIFVFPSTTDTFGLVVLEAQASGLPVVVSDAGGPKEAMKDGKTGFVTRANDLNDFINKTIKLIKDTKLRKEMGKNAIQLAREYKWDRVFDELITIYYKVKKDAERQNI